MENKKFSLSIEEARHLYNSNDENIRNIALRAYSEDELSFDFSDIKTFEDACRVLGLNYKKCSGKAREIAKDSKASAAMFKLNIVRKALNLGMNLHLVKSPKNSHIYYPNNFFITKVEGSYHYKDELNSGIVKIIGEIRAEGISYYVLNGISHFDSNDGLGSFRYSTATGYASADIGFLGCASQEIAEYFGKYFGMLITEAKYGDIIEDFEIIESKYKN